MTKIEKYIDDNFNDIKKWIIDNDPGGVEFKILKYISDIDNGVFVEVGAHDGIFQSNTLILEQLGWTGILIEASDTLYQKCLENRNCIIENYALVSDNYNSNTININDIKLMGHHLTGGSNSKSYCKSVSFTELANKYNILNIDIFILDVEGYELEVLKGIDFDKINIKYFLIEHNEDSYPSQNMVDLMNSVGYTQIENISNFRLKDTKSPKWPGTHQDYLYKKLKN